LASWAQEKSCRVPFNSSLAWISWTIVMPNSKARLKSSGQDFGKIITYTDLTKRLILFYSARLASWVTQILWECCTIHFC
jgi:hypothetical protein